jgi:3-oxoacyl-[acyl-carrier protein] reductase
MVVLITGAAGGLGRAMSLGLLAVGHSVVAVDVAAAAPAMEALLTSARVAGAGERIASATADIRSAEDCERAVAEARMRFGRIDALVNNAGIKAHSSRALQPFYEVPLERWLAVVNTNVNGTYFMARAVAPHLVAQGWGRIVNVLTSVTTMVRGGYSPYGPSKAVVEAATNGWAGDLDGTGVTVNGLLPGGSADTAMVSTEDVADRSKLISPYVMVAPLRWLCSRASDGVTGYRFIGKDWELDRPLAENVARAGARVAWRDLMPA